MRNVSLEQVRHISRFLLLRFVLRFFIAWPYNFILSDFKYTFKDS